MPWPSSTGANHQHRRADPLSPPQRKTRLSVGGSEPAHAFGPGRIIGFGVRYEEQQPIAIIVGHPEKAAEPLVRLHSACFTGDLLASLRCDCGDQLRSPWR